MLEEYAGSGSISKEEAPVQGIDWGPDPEPVYSSQLNKSQQFSKDEIRSLESIPVNKSIDGDQPYQNFPSIMTGFTNSLIEQPQKYSPKKAKLTTAQ